MSCFRKRKKKSKKYHFWPKRQKIVIFKGYFRFFQEPHFVKSWGFFRCVQCIKTLLLSYQKLGGSKNYPTWKKRSKKNSEKNSNQGAKRNKKMGGRCHVITLGVFPFKNGTLYYTVYGRIQCRIKRRTRYSVGQDTEQAAKYPATMWGVVWEAFNWYSSHRAQNQFLLPVRTSSAFDQSRYGVDWAE